MSAAVDSEPARPTLADRAAADVPALLDRSLLYVTGKGGAGKTTVSAALGMAALGRGRTTLVCELAGAQRLAQAFGRPPQEAREVRLTDELWSLSIDPREALTEWLRRQPGGAVAATVLRRSAAFEHFVAAAPGAKEIVTIGKVVDLTGRGTDGARRPTFDLVIVDGPATGHALGMLAAPRAIGRVAPRGPVGAQARVLRDFLADPESTGYVAASLPEDMSVREVIDLERRLPDAVGRELDLIVVDGMYPDRFSDDEAARLETLAERYSEVGALRAALSQHRRARRQADRLRWLRERARAPIVTLPYLFAPRLRAAEYELLARRLGRVATDA